MLLVAEPKTVQPNQSGMAQSGFQILSVNYLSVSNRLVQARRMIALIFSPSNNLLNIRTYWSGNLCECKLESMRARQCPSSDQVGKLGHMKASCSVHSASFITNLLQ